MSFVRLGVNVDHVASIRNLRAGTHPDPIKAAQLAIEAGADLITMHLREDRRHINEGDIKRARSLPVPLNMEMAPTEEMNDLACMIRPYACCLVPERRAELTTEGGLDVVGQFAVLKPLVDRLQGVGIRVAVFVDPELNQIESAVSLGVPAVELHTGAYAGGKAGELDRLRAAAGRAHELGVEVHAGHGLNFANVASIAAIPQLRELNIGHFLVGEAMFIGLLDAVRRMRSLIEAARQSLGVL